MFIAGYILIGGGVSAVHYWNLLQQQQQLAAEIGQVQRATATLDGDLRVLHNPRALRQILLGQRPLPADLVSIPAIVP